MKRSSSALKLIVMWVIAVVAYIVVSRFFLRLDSRMLDAAIKNSMPLNTTFFFLNIAWAGITIAFLLGSRKIWNLFLDII